MADVFCVQGMASGDDNFIASGQNKTRVFSGRNIFALFVIHFMIFLIHYKDSFYNILNSFDNIPEDFVFFGVS